MQRYKEGRSGAYTETYHKLLGKSPWIVIRNIEHPGGPNKRNREKVASGGNDLNANDDECCSTSLSEGDIATVFSQFGEVIDVRLVRHQRTGRFLGTAFVKFEDYRSAILAADEMNSNHEKGKEVSLTTTGRAPSQRGIEVARCEEVEVCALPSGAESYAEWLSRVVLEAR
ncbi:RNA-binding protein, putative [Trypanosoma brucei gambiense DAL972]|uniref:RNA-binding protein, putative n=2 Tax=Trypanosoma brucei TaxID=5691 RepID=C9ZS05_TRYB9|nr:RNA-binding protein, putative [Trypanosoma brucei gambiense DAL972]RHW71465.1 RNA-binding protein [Trypanosoma brucei equiperdum]CBH12141.1 RNA-binding protein, putative [Trypanosoma brucei gambiense DAL972]|eukprot:XP_011774424.1 RNA-binding protein, putative [Trypanosoma brucei gambiense DAL972]